MFLRLKMNKKIIQISFLLSIIFQYDTHAIGEKISMPQKFLTIRECINNFRDESTIFLIDDLDYTTQYIIDAYKYTYGVEGSIEKIDKIKERTLRENNVIAIGTQQNNYFIKQCLDKLPIKFDSLSVTIENKKYFGDDLSIMLSMQNPYNLEKYCIISTTNNLSSYSPIIHYQWKDWGFIINRRSDGKFYDTDNLAMGNFKLHKNRICIEDLLQCFRPDLHLGYRKPILYFCPGSW